MHEKVTIGGAELYCADCRDVLPELRADACVTDPPYGVELGSGDQRGKALLIAGVAQLVEQRIRNAKVGGSTPLAGTTIQNRVTPSQSARGPGIPHRPG